MDDDPRSKSGQSYDQRQIMADLVAQQYRRNDQVFKEVLRVRGDVLGFSSTP